jgi:hypothetical protein
MNQQPLHEISKTVEHSVVIELNLFGLRIEFFYLAIFGYVVKALVADLLVDFSEGV